MIEVAFRPAGKVYYYEPGEFELATGEQVVVESSRGMQLGYVVKTGLEISDPLILKEVRPIIRKALPEDLKRDYENRVKAKRAFQTGWEKIKEHNLPMKLVSVEYTLDAEKIVFYFTSAGRVDFRELVKDLAKTFKKRIELYQIGVRDEAKMLGCLGPCGQMICCFRFLREFTPVSIKMAKTQNLTLNPIKISGACGRLVCCLSYEQEAYLDALLRLPQLGDTVETLEGNQRGRVVELNVPKEKVLVELEANNVRTEFAADKLRVLKFERPPQGKVCPRQVLGANSCPAKPENQAAGKNPADSE